LGAPRHHTNPLKLTNESCELDISSVRKSIKKLHSNVIESNSNASLSLVDSELDHIDNVLNNERRNEYQGENPLTPIHEEQKQAEF
jgi:hypothetical protein